VITFTGVSFAYARGPEVLRGADLDLGTGLSLVLGPNGCGKSTLLKLAAGVEAPTAGNVTIAGHDLWREEVAARRLRTTGATRGTFADVQRAVSSPSPTPAVTSPFRLHPRGGSCPPEPSAALVARGADTPR